MVARGIEGDLQLKPLGVRDDKLLEILQRRYNFLPRVINTISNQKHVRSAGLVSRMIRGLAGIILWKLALFIC